MATEIHIGNLFLVAISMTNRIVPDIITDGMGLCFNVLKVPHTNDVIAMVGLPTQLHIGGVFICANATLDCYVPNDDGAVVLLTIPDIKAFTKAVNVSNDNDVAIVAG